jgi:hypothetical protein
MGGFQFDRQDYARPTPVEPGPGRPFSLAGPLLALAVVVAAVGGFVVYKLVRSGTIGDSRSSNSDLTQIEQRLDAIEHRLDQVERRRKPSIPEAPVAAPKQEPIDTSSHPSPAPVVRTIYRISPPPEPRSAASPPPKSSPDGSQVSQQQQKELDSLRGDVVSTRQEWAATTDRLGDVVGELASQREEISRNQESLGQLAAHFQHNSVPFTLQKGATAQRVGPVSLQLQSINSKNHRYTMRLVLNDKVVELKDRALNEAIQFYGSGGKVLLELVVSEIGRDAVTGRLALPQTTASR